MQSIFLESKYNQKDNNVINLSLCTSVCLNVENGIYGIKFDGINIRWIYESQQDAQQEFKFIKESFVYDRVEQSILDTFLNDK